MKNYRCLIKSSFLSCLFFLTILGTASAQKKDFPHDTSYYETFYHQVTGRIFMSQKYIHFTLPSTTGAKDLQYVANPKLNLGIGVTWHNLSLNVFYGFGYLNNKDTIKGKTKGLDLQLHVFPRKWIIDVFAVMPKGFHINPKGFGSTDPSKYYYNPLIKERIYGFAAYRLPNKKEFSYRAALNGNEWQKKSAGSFLYGGNAYYHIMESGNDDSVLVPASLRASFPRLNGITEARFITIGPGGGYAYTLVIEKHLFIMVSLVFHLDVNIMTEEHGEDKADWVKNTAIAPALAYKSAIGYNSANWGFSVSASGNNFWAKGSSDQRYSIMGGGLRFSLTKKFDSGKK